MWRALACVTVPPVTFVRGALSIALLTLVACAGDTEADDENPETATGAILGGTETFDRPEVGKLVHNNAYCTATLIRPNVVLSAAHCVSGSPKGEAQTGYSFTIQTSPTEKQRFEIDNVYSVPVAADFDGTQKWRDKDIALLRLTKSVPARLAAPASVATRQPWPGATLAVYGYGCTDRATRTGGGTKRKKTSTYSMSRALGWSHPQDVCPGDSGGPLFDVFANSVIGTTSGFVNGDDRWGDIPANHDLVNRVADGWSAE